MLMSIRKARVGDLGAIALIASESFIGMRQLGLAKKWVLCSWNSRPRMMYWVAEYGGKVVGYILWSELGGFRGDAVFDLDQLGVDPDYRRKGLGERLVRESLSQIRVMLAKRGSRLKLVQITTGSEQHAVEFYKRALGAQIVAVLPQFFRSDELVLIARF